MKINHKILPELEPSEPVPGMSLRDYYACKAMEKILSRNNGRLQVYDVVKQAYLIADAMLEEKNK